MYISKTIFHSELMKFLINYFISFFVHFISYFWTLEHVYFKHHKTLCQLREGHVSFAFSLFHTSLYKKMHKNLGKFLLSAQLEVLRWGFRERERESPESIWKYQASCDGRQATNVSNARSLNKIYRSQMTCHAVSNNGSRGGQGEESRAQRKDNCKTGCGCLGNRTNLHKQRASIWTQASV